MTEMTKTKNTVGIFGIGKGHSPVFPHFIHELNRTHEECVDLFFICCSLFHEEDALTMAAFTSFIEATQPHQHSKGKTMAPREDNRK